METRALSSQTCAFCPAGPSRLHSAPAASPSSMIPIAQAAAQAGGRRRTLQSAISLLCHDAAQSAPSSLPSIAPHQHCPHQEQASCSHRDPRGLWPPLGTRLFSTQSQPAPSDVPAELDELRKLPGYLKGPLGRRAARAYGEEEWVEAKDPVTGKPCWRNIKTEEYTSPGVPKPDTWTEVVDKKTGLIYYWNRKSGETTTIGEQKPGAYGRVLGSSPDPSLQPKSSGEATVFDSIEDEKAARKKESFAEQVMFWVRALNTPSGYAFVGFTSLAALWELMRYAGN